MRRFHGVVFDFDGVIVNSEPLHLQAYQDVLTGWGISLDADAYYNRYLGFDDEGVFRAVASDFGVTVTGRDMAAIIERKGHRYEALASERPIVIASAVRLVARLAERGVPMAIASGALAPEIETILTGASMRHYFRAIVASGDTAASKPAPDPYARAVDLLASTIETAQSADLHPSGFVAIEDSHWGLLSARAAGLRTIGITTTYPASALREADVIVQSLDEITIEILERLCDL